jgi:hypothetical protein
MKWTRQLRQGTLTKIWRCVGKRWAVSFSSLRHHQRTQTPTTRREKYEAEMEQQIAREEPHPKPQHDHPSQAVAPSEPDGSCRESLLTTVSRQKC